MKRDERIFRETSRRNQDLLKKEVQMLKRQIDVMKRVEENNRAQIEVIFFRNIFWEY
jgi:hypothetical protein